jgi:hypothetical protein
MPKEAQLYFKWADCFDKCGLKLNSDFLFIIYENAGQGVEGNSENSKGFSLERII